ncbi:hypothetical protein Tco_0042315, partial [Tanacetum coccineum]
TRLAEIDADFTRCCIRFQESFHPHLLNLIAGRRWLLTHGMKLLVVKCLNSNEYMEAMGHAFGRAIEKGMQEGLAAGIEHGKKDASTWDIMNLLRLDDTVTETLDVFTSIEDPLSAEALIEPSAEAPATNVLSTMVIVPPPNPSISVEDYDNPDPAVVVPKNTTSGLEHEGPIDASAGGGLTFSQLDDEARDAVL